MSSNVQSNNQIKAAGAAKATLVLAGAQHGSETLLFNRELSRVEFFRQVLEAGLEQEVPLLERLRFVTIFSSIVDEFFMIRISGLKEEFEEGWVQPSPDGLTTEEQLREIRHRLRPMIARQRRCILEEVLPQLAEQRIVLAAYESLSREERYELDGYFRQNVFPVLTPLAVDPAHPFPYISGLSLNLGVMVESRDEPRSIDRSEARFVRLKAPPVLRGLVRIGRESKFIFLSELIGANLGVLFPGMRVGRAHAFRVTRDADIEIREDEADDLLHALQKELSKRRFGTPVRLEVAADMPDAMLDYLTNSLGLESDDIYPIDGPLNVADLLELCELNRPNLKFRPLRTSVPEVLRAGRPIFDVIKEQDLLLHHPYIAYSTVTDFIRAAANDPDVLAIKICLYRTGQQSAIAEALIAAGEQGKQVTALIELKAPFDEENNSEWAQLLARAGGHGGYGFVSLTTDCT